MRLSLAMILASLLMLSIAYVQVAHAPDVQVPYFIKYTYTITEDQVLDLVLNASDHFEYKPPSPPEGMEGSTYTDFKLNYVEVFIPKAVASVLKVTGEDYKVRISEDYVSYRFYSTTPVRIENTGDSALVISLPVKVTYVHEEWVQVKSTSAEINVLPPPIPFTSGNVSISLEIPPYTPLAFSSLITPDDIDIISLKAQEEFDPEAISVSPRFVSLSLRQLPYGKYIVGLEPAKPLPACRLYKSMEILNLTIPAMSSRLIAMPAPPNGWEFSHIEAVIATISVMKPSIKGEISVEAPIVDLAYGISGTIPVKFIKAKYALKAYTVYSNRFTIVNKLNIPIIVYLVPFVYREIGEWSPLGLTVKVDRADVDRSTYAFLEVDIPNGVIKEVTLPSNMAVGHYYDSSVPWSGDVNRTISSLPHYALIQVAHDEVVETGTYSFKIDWLPISFRIVDSKGRPLEKGMARLYDNETSIPQEIVGGIARITPYKPSIYRLEVKYKDVVVYDEYVGFPVKPEYMIPCKVYDLVVEVVGARGQPLEKAVVNLTAVEGKAIAKATNGSGMVCFEQLPIGEYQLSVSYKNVGDALMVSLTDNIKETIKLDVFIEVPGTNLALGADETAIVTVVFIGLMALIGFIVRRKRQEVVLH
ncbi:MAG: carboxypeptidase regulatory-like domain-containing protein [Thermoprotei archaeon]|nr:carboxypeptidase regulatory-like domain-containing protein [Thermoprotei archaeon]